MSGSLAHPRMAGVAGSGNSPACDGRSRGAARRTSMGQPDGGRAALGQQALDPQPRGRSLVGQVLAGTAGGRVRVERDLPPGQLVRPDWPAQHYGRVPRFRPDTWTFTVTGAT